MEQNKKNLIIDYLDGDFKNTKNNNIEELVDWNQNKAEAKEEWNRIQFKQEQLRNNLEMINDDKPLFKKLNDAIDAVKNKTPTKKLYQIYLTKELMQAIEIFMRNNGITKKTAAIEMLIRLALGLKQI